MGDELGKNFLLQFIVVKTHAYKMKIVLCNDHYAYRNHSSVLAIYYCLQMCRVRLLFTAVFLMKV